MNKLKEKWADIFIFILASVWTAGGVFMAITVVIDNRELINFEQFMEVLVFLNLAILIIYTGFKTQIKLYKEW